MAIQGRTADPGPSVLIDIPGRFANTTQPMWKTSVDQRITGGGAVLDRETDKVEVVRTDFQQHVSGDRARRVRAVQISLLFEKRF